MSETANEALRREASARAAIRNAFDTPQARDSVTLFISHHLDELEADYWREHFGDDAPTPEAILDRLELHKHWSPGEDGGVRYFDFTLPGEVTDYVISVRFDDAGDVAEVSMES
jgi:Protein of unknown function (DUF2004)